MKRLLLFFVLLFVASQAFAGDAWWYGGSGNGQWSWASNWAGGSIGGTNVGGYYADDVKFWPSTGKGSATLNSSTEITWLSLSIGGCPEVSSQLIVDGAALTINGNSTWVGNIPGMSATIRIKNSGSISTPGAFRVVSDGVGSLIINSGLLRVTNWFELVGNGAGSSHVSMTGGVIDADAFWMTGSNLLMELNGGEVVIRTMGDFTAQITDWMNLGRITGNQVATNYDAQTGYTHITSTPIQTQDAWWYGSSGDGMWGTSANWAGGSIGGTTVGGYFAGNVMFWPSTGKGSATLNSSTEISNLSLSIGGGAPESSSQLIVDGAALTINGNSTWVGNVAGMSATMQITNGGSVLTPGAFRVVSDGNGELIMDSGLLRVDNWFELVGNGAGSSHVSMTGGVIDADSFWMTGSNLLMELKGGEVILTSRGNVTGEIANWMNLGWITGNQVATYYDAQTGYTHITSVGTPIGDLNNDNLIDMNDISLLASEWLEAGVNGYQDYFPRGYQSGEIASLQVPRAVTPPVIDGKFYPNEWDGAMTVEVSYPDIDTAPKDAEKWAGAWPSTSAEFSGTWYFKWDANNLYIAASIYDNSPSSGDKIQLGFDFGNTAPEYLWDNSAIYDFSVSSDGTASIYRHHNDTYIGPFTTEQRAAISYKGSAFNNGYIYETAIPWWVIDYLNVPSTYVPSVNDKHGISLLHLNYNGLDLTTAMSAFSPLPWAGAGGSFATKTITLVESSTQDSNYSWNTGPTHYYPLESIADIYQEAQPNDIVNFKDFAKLAENWLFGY